MSPLETMRERRAAKKQELDELLSGPTAEVRDLTEAESTSFDVLVEEIRRADERINGLADEESRSSAAAASRVETGQVGDQQRAVGGAKVTEQPVYSKHNMEQSYFRDLFSATQQGNPDAMERLRRNTRIENETRALGNTGAVGGSGGLVLLAAAVA